MAAGGAEAQRAFAAMMEMGKIDVARIEAARHGAPSAKPAKATVRAQPDGRTKAAALKKAAAPKKAATRPKARR